MILAQEANLIMVLGGVAVCSWGGKTTLVFRVGLPGSYLKFMKHLECHVEGRCPGKVGRFSSSAGTVVLRIQISVLCNPGVGAGGRAFCVHF